MSEQLLPMPSAEGGLQRSAYSAPTAWSEPPAPPEAPAGAAVGRFVDALKRYKWILLGVIALGIAGGVVAMRFVQIGRAHV